MTINPVFILLLLAVSSLAHPLLSCNCGLNCGNCGLVPGIPGNCGLGSGEDMCHNDNNQNEKCTPLVVRPVEIPKPALPIPPPLIPLKNPCACHTSIVKPAVVPQPICLAGCGSTIRTNHQCSHSQCSSCNRQQQVTTTCGGRGVLSPAGVLPVTPVLVDDAADSPVNPADYVPADPVSLHVAYKLAQEKCHHNEDHLAFGFRSLPKEIPLYGGVHRRTGNNIPEENLFSLNGQIVELKAKKCTSQKSLDEEAREQLIQMAEDEAEENLDAGVNRVKHVSLGEIGYGPAKIKEPIFIEVPPALGSAGGALDDGLSAPIKCNDGFKPGNVLITEIPKENILSFPPQLPEPCAPEPEAFIPPPPALPPPGTLFTSPYTYLSSSSSSSAASSNLYKKSVLLQKVGCN